MTSRWTTDKRLAAVLGSTLGAALLFRCIQLGRQSLWLDEVASWSFASGDIHRAIFSDPFNPPLYYLILHFWMGLFGSSEAALRSLSIIPSMISVWLVYRLCKTLFCPEVAYLAAAYQAISTFQIYYAQEARCYALFNCFVLMGTLCLWHALSADSQRRRVAWYIGYSICVALGLYTHFISAFFVVAHGLFVLLRRPRQLVAAVLSVGLGLILFVPWLPHLLTASNRGADLPVKRYLLMKFPQAYFTFLFGESLVPMDEQAVQHIRATLLANGWVVAVSMMALAVLIPYGWLAWKRWRDSMLYVVMLAVVPCAATFLVSFKTPLFDRRHVMPAASFVLISAAAAIWEVIARQRDRNVAHTWKTWAGQAAIGAQAFLVLLSLYHYYFDPRFRKEQWREAVLYIEDASTSLPGKTLLVFDPDYLSPCYRYYQKRNLPVWGITSSAHDEILRSSTAIARHVHGYGSVLLIRAHYDNDVVLTTLRSMLPQESYREFPRAKGIEVFAFKVAQNKAN